MSLFTDLLQNPTIAGVRTSIIGYAQAAGLAITNWVVGSVGEQMLATVATAVYTQALTVAQLIRGFASLDSSTDPGDPDPFNPGNEDLPDAPGLLSALGENVFGTVRGSATFANGFVTFDNSSGPVARTFAPGGLTFTWTSVSPPSPAPTYRNAPDPTIYTNADGTVTVPAGAPPLPIPVVAEEIGTRSNAPVNGLSLTTTLVGVTATNAAPIQGTDREDADVYRKRCRQAAARTSLGGAAAIYEYLASKTLEGAPLLNEFGDQVAITRVYVSEESAVGNVDTYFATAFGAPTAEDVDAANLNIQTFALATPGAITFGPDPDGGRAAVEVPIAITGTGKIKSRPGTPDSELKAKAQVAIADALQLAFRDFPIGGVDQTAGAGVIYTIDLQAIAADAFDGLYNVQVTIPAGPTTPIPLGHVATTTTASTDWTVTVMP